MTILCNISRLLLCKVTLGLASFFNVYLRISGDWCFFHFTMGRIGTLYWPIGIIEANCGQHFQSLIDTSYSNLVLSLSPCPISSARAMPQYFCTNQWSLGMPKRWCHLHPQRGWMCTRKGTKSMVWSEDWILEKSTTYSWKATAMFFSKWCGCELFKSLKNTQKKNTAQK